MFLYRLIAVEVAMKRESAEMLRKEQKLAQQAGEQGDTGRPGGGQGRRDETGITPVYPASAPMEPPGNARLQPLGTLGQGDRGPQGYQDSGSSEIIPNERFTQEESGTHTTDLSGLRVAALVTDGFEESELIEPVNALQKAGAHVEVVSPRPGTVQAFRHLDKGRTVPVDQLLHDVRADDYDALLLPGGALNADALRSLPDAQAFARHFQEAGKPMAIICHGPWLLVSANLVRGRRPGDLPAFNRAMLQLFAQAPAHR
jgi:PfpI family intracellular protease